MRSWSYTDYLETPTAADPLSPDIATWPPDLRALLDEIRTIEGLDVVCAVAREPFKAWPIGELPGAHGGDGVAFTEALLHLVSRGFIERRDDGAIQFAVTGARTAAVHALCRICEDDRPTLLAGLAQLSIGRVRAAAARTLAGRYARPETED